LETKLIEYYASGTSYIHDADSWELIFSPGPTNVTKSCTTEWRVGKGSVSNPEQRTRFRGPMEETYTITGSLPHTGLYSVQTMEDLSKRNSKFRLETPLVSPVCNGVEDDLYADFPPGSKTITVYDTTGFAADDFIQIGTGSEQMEVKIIDSVSSPHTIVLKVATGATHTHLQHELVKQVEPVYCIIESVELNQTEIKITTYEGVATEFIQYTLKLRRVRDNDCSGEI
jgi:hypothetical protein